MLTSTGMNGPPLVITLQAMKLRPDSFRATLQAVFCSQDVAAVAGFVAVGQLLHRAGRDRGRPARTASGWLLGDRVFTGIDAGMFRRIVLGMLVLSALAAGLSAVVG